MGIAKKILVIGGAGFIGSHMTLSLHQAGFQPIVLDNLSTGHRHAVLNHEFIYGDLADISLLDALFHQHAFAAVMHFASFIEVEESVRLPLKYYQNNVAATLNLFEIMLKHNVLNLIFSSSAAVYGNPITPLINESHPCQPINPYGRSKLMLEQIIQDISRQTELRYAILRYFNASGADPLGRLSEQHHPESHLIPLVLQTAAGLRPTIIIYGNDYSTIDGTCIRDYVHVVDLCNAHLQALQKLLAKSDNIICNLGAGKGTSVLEVINTARKITGKNINYEFSARRMGDPTTLVADITLAKKLLNWSPMYSSLETIVKDTFNGIRQLHVA